MNHSKKPIIFTPKEREKIHTFVPTRKNKRKKAPLRLKGQNAPAEIYVWGVEKKRREREKTKKRI